jgi:hypothetical protein
MGESIQMPIQNPRNFFPVMYLVQRTKIAFTSGINVYRTSFSDKETEYLLGNSDTDVLSENEHSYKEENDSSGKEEEDSSTTWDCLQIDNRGPTR